MGKENWVAMRIFTVVTHKKGTLRCIHMKFWFHNIQFWFEVMISLKKGKNNHVVVMNLNKETMWWEVGWIQMHPRKVPNFKSDNLKGRLIHMNLVPMWNRPKNENVKFENLWVTYLKEIWLKNNVVSHGYCMHVI
jgi:hypothetical protein